VRHTLSNQYLSLGLTGAYQANNLSTVLATIAVLNERGYTITDSHIQNGLRLARWPGRFQQFPAARCIVDGAHNPEGFHSLLHSIQTLYPTQPWHWLVSLRANRDPALLANVIATCGAERVICTTGPREWIYHSPDGLKQALASAGVNCEIKPLEHLPQAYTEWRSGIQQDANHLVMGLATGSLYTSGYILQHLQLRPDD
jgi:dihydrofolate synthase/folylpolyglutamate synthase